MASHDIFMDCYLNTMRMGKFHYSDSTQFNLWEFLVNVVCRRSNVTAPQQLMEVRLWAKKSGKYLVKAIHQIADLKKLERHYDMSGKYILSVKFLRDSDVAMLNSVDPEIPITLFRRPSKRAIKIVVGCDVRRITAPNGTNVEFKCANNRLSLTISMTGVYEIHFW